MKHTLILPGTGLSVSPFGLGCTRAGSAWTGDRADRLLDFFLDHGGNVIDTARIYGFPDIGASEATLGEWLHRRGRRRDARRLRQGRTEARACSQGCQDRRSARRGRQGTDEGGLRLREPGQ